MIAVVPRKIPAVDNALSSTSTNPVQNMVIKNEFDSISQRISNVESPAQVWSDVSFTINVEDWTLDSGSNSYKMTVTSSDINETSGVFVFYDESLENATSPITAEETTGQVTFITGSVPDGVITGTIRIVDSVNGIVPISRGGTGVAAENSADLLAQLGAAPVSDAFFSQNNAAASAINGGSSAGYHNSVFRGKYLGNSFTEAQHNAINSGTFEDLYIGDYWTINGVNWRIAGFDPAYRCGDTSLDKHHVIIVPDTSLVSSKLNDTNTTEGGYIGCDFRTGNNDNTARATATSAFENAFGSTHILSYRDILTNATDATGATGWGWADARVELLNEVAVYGTKVWANGGFDVGIFNSQLPLFAMAPQFIHPRFDWWLRSVSSGTDFAVVYVDGYAADWGASYVFGVRPLALLN